MGGSIADRIGASARRGQNNVLQPGATVREALERSDSRLSTGEYADGWRFRARRGQTYTLTLQSGDFDAYLVARGPGGLSEDNDDDPGSRGSTDSAITFTAAALSRSSPLHRLQPAKRRKTAGRPAWPPSPCTVRKVSLTE